MEALYKELEGGDFDKADPKKCIANIKHLKLLTHLGLIATQGYAHRYRHEVYEDRMKKIEKVMGMLMKEYPKEFI